MQLTVSTAPNFRDFGGLPTQDGRRIRRGWLYRSDALDTLTDDDLDMLDPLGIRIVCDLRSERERAEAPTRMPPNWKPEVLTVDNRFDTGAADISRVLRKEMHTSAAGARVYMAETYQAFPEQFAEMLREVFARLADGQGPLLMHCTAGKDRTGFTCAMLQHALGVDSETVMHGYLLSDRYFGADRIAQVIGRYLGFTPPPGNDGPDAGQAEYMEATFAKINERYGSVDHYLEQCAGLSDERRAALRACLLEPAS